MPRKSKKFIKELMNKNNVGDIYSWSKYSTLLENEYSYFLKYILKEKPDMPNSAYGHLGGIAHDILEKYYENEIEYDDMIDEWEEKIEEFNESNLKFDRNNEVMDNKIRKNYILAINNFFIAHKPTKAKKRANEKFISTMVGDYLFHGYIDCMEIVGNEVVITDYKTSTMYKGDKLLKNQGQLLLYAIAIHNLTNMPYNRIKVRWNFLKYIDVSYKLKNGKTKIRTLSRIDYVYKLSSILKKKAKDLGYDEDDFETTLGRATSSNNFDLIPNDIKEQFTLDDCYVYVKTSQDNIDNLTNEINGKLKEVEEKKAMYLEDKNDKHFWKDIMENDVFFLVTLGDYSAKLHKPLKAYFDKKEAFNDDNIDEILEMFGIE